MIELAEFKKLVAEIAAQGYTEEEAADYAALLGDTPAYDEHGNVVVMDGDQLLATLKPLKFYE